MIYFDSIKDADLSYEYWLLCETVDAGEAEEAEEGPDSDQGHAGNDQFPSCWDLYIETETTTTSSLPHSVTFISSLGHSE